MRVGPEQVDLDGAVERGVERHGRGGVDDGVAARSTARPASSRPSPSVPTSPATTVTRRATSARRRPCRRARRAAGRRRRCGRSRAAPAARRCASARADEQHELAAGTDRSRRSTSAVPRKPVAPVTEMRFPASASATDAAGAGVGALSGAIGRDTTQALYQMVEQTVLWSSPPVSASWRRPWKGSRGEGSWRRLSTTWPRRSGSASRRSSTGSGRRTTWSAACSRRPWRSWARRSSGP